MTDPQRDQKIRVQVRVHMRVQIRSELVLASYISLHDRALLIQPVVLGLAHQSLGNRRNMRLGLDPPVRINIGDLGVPQPENIDQLVIPVYVAGHHSLYYQKSVLPFRQRQVAQCGQIADQISRAMVGRGEDEMHGGRFAGAGRGGLSGRGGCGRCLSVAFHIQINNYIFLFVEIKTLKSFHR